MHAANYIQPIEDNLLFDLVTPSRSFLRTGPFYFYKGRIYDLDGIVQCSLFNKLMNNELFIKAKPEIYKGNEYFFIDLDGKIQKKHVEDDADVARWYFGNYFINEKEALFLKDDIHEDLVSMMKNISTDDGKEDKEFAESDNSIK